MRPINRNLKTLRMYLPAGMSRRQAAVLLSALVGMFVWLTYALSQSPKSPTVDDWIVELKREPSPLKDKAISALNRLPFVEINTQDLNEIHRKAAEELGKRKREAITAIPVLGLRMSETNGPVAYQAMNTLTEIGTPAVPDLLLLSKSKQKQTRELAMIALIAIKPIKVGVIERLTSALQDEDVYIRIVAARKLSELGPKASMAVPALRRALNDQDKRMRLCSAVALWKINHEYAEQGLVECVDFNCRKYYNVIITVIYSPMIRNWIENTDFQSIAVESLGEMIPENQVALNLLVSFTTKTNETLRVNAIETLWTKTKRPELVLPALANFPDQMLPEGLLGEIGPAAKAFAPRVAKLARLNAFHYNPYLDSLEHIDPDLAKSVRKELAERDNSTNTPTAANIVSRQTSQ